MLETINFFCDFILVFRVFEFGDRYNSTIILFVNIFSQYERDFNVEMMILMQNKWAHAQIDFSFIFEEFSKLEKLNLQLKIDRDGTPPWKKFQNMTPSKLNFSSLSLISTQFMMRWPYLSYSRVPTQKLNQCSARHQPSYFV